MATTWRFGGLCACGCGAKTNLAPRDHKALGWKKDEPYEYIRNHQSKTKGKGYEVDPGTGCHVWKGAPSQRYPKVRVEGKQRAVHLIAWEREHGSIPEGMVVHHRCENTRCCNVEHLEVVTQATNAHVGPHVKLSMETADKIRQLAATRQYSHQKLAEMFGVSRNSIQNVVYGHTWRPVELHRPYRKP